MRTSFAAAAGLVTLTVGTVFPAGAQSGDEAGEVQVARIPKEKIPPAPPLKPAEALKTFRIAPGLRVELVASEPMVEVPVLAQFDPDGRMWVVEMRSFMVNPDGTGEDQPTSRISILEDTDGDGRMDRKKVFLDGLVMPRALLLVQGGVLVCEPPQLWFYPNVDDRPGERVLVAADFAKEADPKLGQHMNPEHSGNSLLLGMDNWIYSLYHPYRYRLAGGKWIREADPQRVQWGLSRDDFGRLFYTSNSDQLRGDLVPTHYFGSVPGNHKAPGVGIQIASDQSVWPIRVNPGVNRAYEPGALREDGTLSKFTAACGTVIYRGDLLPADFYGNAFVCEPAANVIRRNILADVDGMVTATNAYVKREFLASTDELFRPVNLHTGPDGALYIVDMYHGIIQHRLFLTSYLRGQAEDRGLHKVTDYGRIWRVVPEGRTPGPRPALRRAGTKDLVRALAHPNGWWRDTAQRLLVERNDPGAVPALEALARSAASAVTRLHALWSLEGMTRLTQPTVESALADAQPKVRAAGIRLSEPFLGEMSPGNSIRGKVFALINDPAADVRVQLALTLGTLKNEPASHERLTALAAKSTGGLASDAAAYVIARCAPAKVEAAAGPAKEGRPLTAEEKRRLADGRVMYEATCLACHQQHGLGQPGLAPPLVDSEWVAGSPARLIRIVLHGLRGPIKVKGEMYEMDMPALGVLEDEQIAAALSYVRREWGHTFDPVSPDEVKKVRDETAAREDAWTMTDLLRIP